MSYSKMLLPFVIYMLHCWGLFWMTITPPVTSSTCPPQCKCMWKGGKSTAECTGGFLTAIPTGLEVGTQVLNVSINNLQNLSNDVFLRAKLVNLQRIYLSNCSIGHIHEGAFTRLTNLVELDLSNNQLVNVPTATFKAIQHLLRLFLNGNPIKRIENKAFAALQSLTTLELSRCHLDSVAPEAFQGLIKLTILKLDTNRLTTLSAMTVQPLEGLHGVHLHGNPWKCDCSMQAIKKWLAEYNIPCNPPPTCAQPPRLKGSKLTDLQMAELACQPQSLYSNRRVHVTIGHNASLACKVTANPSPTIQWLRQGQLVVNLTRFFHGAQMYVIQEREGHTDKVSTLTITRVTEQDSGQYVCIAENNGGTFSANFTLDVTYADLEASGLTSGQIAGISLGLFVLGAIVLLLICILLAKWRQVNRGDAKHPPLNQSQHKLMNSVNHVDYNKSDHNKHKNSVRMSFSLPRLSRSSSTQRNNSDDASDSDRTLIENLTSPSKSSTCNLSNKPDVVNVERNTSSAQSRTKKDKETKKKEKRSKEKRKDRHRWKDSNTGRVPGRPGGKGDGQGHRGPPGGGGGGVDNPPKEDNLTKLWPDSDKRCNSVLSTSKSNTKMDEADDMETLKSHLRPDKKVFEDDNRYGSYGNLKLSASSEWNKVANEMIENAGFARDHDDGTPESYELIDKKSWGSVGGGCSKGMGPCTDMSNVVVGVSDSSGCNRTLTTNKTILSPVTGPTTAVLSIVDNNGGGLKDSNGGINNITLSRNSNVRFRHYVPVLPPLPAHHYSHVRNSLIRTCTDSADDITDM